MLQRILKIYFKQKNTRLISKMVSDSMLSKSPPNILVFTEDENEFKKLKSFLQQILGHNSYTIYRLDFNDLTNSSLWIPSCALLITSETQNEHNLPEKFTSYMNFLKIGGNILSVPSLQGNLKQEFKKINLNKLIFCPSLYGFEAYYQNNITFDKTSWTEAPVDLNELFYIYSNPEEYKGNHFVSKVNIIISRF